MLLWFPLSIGFPFTSIQVNKNYESALHVDRNNMGRSMIIGLGNYQQGQVWVHGPGALDVKGRWCEFDGNVAVRRLRAAGARAVLLPALQTKCRRELQPARGAAGRSLRLVCLWPAGRLQHCTMPYKGTRYTLIYFVQQSYTKLGEMRGDGKDTELARALGFPMPEKQLFKAMYDTKEMRLHRGAIALRALQTAGLTARCSPSPPNALSNEARRRALSSNSLCHSRLDTAAPA